jgi:hypothetical protein
MENLNQAGDMTLEQAASQFPQFVSQDLLKKIEEDLVTIK